MILPDMDEETEMAGQSILPNNITEEEVIKIVTILFTFHLILIDFADNHRRNKSIRKRRSGC